MIFLSKTPICFTASVFEEYANCKVYIFLEIREGVLRRFLPLKCFSKFHLKLKEKMIMIFYFINMYFKNILRKELYRILFLARVENNKYFD